MGYMKKGDVTVPEEVQRELRYRGRYHASQLENDCYNHFSWFDSEDMVKRRRGETFKAEIFEYLPPNRHLWMDFGGNDRIWIQNIL